MRRRALSALLLLLLATPVPALCAMCVPDACPMEEPVVEETGCHGMSHAMPAPDATLDAVTPDCCLSATPARETAAAVVPALDAPQQVSGLNVLQPLAPSTSTATSEAPPPDLIRPLYTLHASLLI